MLSLTDIKEYLDDNKDKIEFLFPKIKNIYVYFLNNRFSCRIQCDGSKHTILFSRLLMEISLNRKLLFDETVDHIDGDSSNDSLDNLQVLSRSENARKGPTEEVKRKIASDNSKRLFLSKEISGENCNLHKLTEDDVKEIRKSFIGITTKFSEIEEKLSKKYNVSTKTILRIRNNKIWKHL